MDWDKEQISYSTQVNRNELSSNRDGLINSRAIQSKFRQFLREFRLGGISETFYYREQLFRNYSKRLYFVIIDFNHFLSFDPMSAELFRENPSIYLPLFEMACKEVISMTFVSSQNNNELKMNENEMMNNNISNIHDIQCQFVNLAQNNLTIRSLDSNYISKLIRISGMIINSSKPSCKATKLVLQCRNCSATIIRHSARGFGLITLPRNCENASNEKNDKKCPIDPFMIVTDKCSYIDIQKLKLQENPEDIPTGEMPRHIWLFVERNLVNKIKPGSRVDIIGIYKIYDSRNNSKQDKLDISVRKPYIEVIGIQEKNVTQKYGIFTAEEEEIIRDLSRTKNIYNIISSSIAPAIWGNLDIKKSIACLLFGGSRKLLSDNMKLRGDINILLLGDPSVAKSQFLKFVDKVAPIAIYTSGKGSSAAGLTASVLREPGSGEFHLEAGAMVLADNGVVCIDEFDKMRENDRVAIHEAMEQQTISIAKAGITTILNSRTSVLAAANPIFGRYDDLRTTSDNIDFETTILSRFDLIFIIKDIKDVTRDKKLAQHIMDLHININKDSNMEEKQTNVISPQLLSKYIAYARHKIHPRLTKKAANLLKNHYVNFRRETKLATAESGEFSGIPLTVRQLESLIRISESLAKMQLSQEANEEHVKEAVRLFKISTLKASKEGIATGGNNELIQNSANNELMKSLQKCERNIKRRLPIGTKTSVKKLINEMVKRNINESVVRKVLDIMHRRDEIEYKQRRRQIYRRK